MLTSSAFTKVLSSEREAFNARFFAARQKWPQLDGEAFKAHLREVVAPLVEIVAQEREERAREVTKVLYELSLEMLGRHWIGPNARFIAIETAWRDWLPTVPHLLSKSPRELVAGMGNVLHTLSTTPDARPEQWLELIQPASALCADIHTWQRAATITAWRCGLAHFRHAALESLRAVDAPIAQAALGLQNITPEHWPHILQRLTEDRWFNPSEIDWTQSDATNRRGAVSQPHLKYFVGAFTGFGGLFSQPPRVMRSGHNFWVWSDRWRVLNFDAFGATIQNAAAPAPTAPTNAIMLNAPWQFETGSGKVVFGTSETTLHYLQNPTSVACDHSTLVVTTPLSHSLYIIAPH